MSNKMATQVTPAQATLHKLILVKKENRQRKYQYVCRYILEGVHSAAALRHYHTLR